MRHELEALLFATGRPLRVEDIAKMTGKEVKVVLDELSKLRAWYTQQDSALIVHETPKGWKLTTKDEYHEVTKKVVTDTELPFPEMETLAVIAYKNPVLQSDVIKVRGAGAYDQITRLEEEGFIKKDKEGRSYLLHLTEHFFKYFDVEGESDIKELFQSKRPVHLMEQLADKVPKPLRHKKAPGHHHIKPESPIVVEHKTSSNDEILAHIDDKDAVVEHPSQESALAEHEKKILQGPSADGREILDTIDQKLQSLSAKLETIHFEKPKNPDDLEDSDERSMPELSPDDDVPTQEKPQA